MEAEIEVTKQEKGRKGIVDVMIKLDQADMLMRKVWSQLQRACKEEGVKSFQIEASSPASPVRERPKTELQRARLRVVELLKAEEDRLAKEAKDQNKKKLETQPREDYEERESSVHTGADMEYTEQDGPNLLPPTLTVDLEVPVKAGPAQGTEDAETKTAEEERETGKALEDEPGAPRVKEQRWTPPEGKRRCGGQCQGCQRKCEDQGLKDCHSCYMNKIRGNKTHGCCNCEKCTNPKPVMNKGNKSKTDKKGKTLGDSLIEENRDRSPSTTSKVGTQLVTFQPGQVESLTKDLESKETEEKEGDDPAEGKRRRLEGDTPPDLKRTSKMPTFKKDAGGSKLPAKASSLIN